LNRACTRPFYQIGISLAAFDRLDQTSPVRGSLGRNASLLREEIAGPISAVLSGLVSLAAKRLISGGALFKPLAIPPALQS